MQSPRAAALLSTEQRDKPVKTPTSMATFAFVSCPKSCRMATLSGGLSIRALGCLSDSCQAERETASALLAHITRVLKLQQSII